MNFRVTYKKDDKYLSMVVSAPSAKEAVRFVEENYNVKVIDVKFQY